MTPIYILLTLVLGVSAYIAWRLQSSGQDGDPRLKAELERKIQEIGELKEQMSGLKSEKQALEVKGKEMSKTYLKLESEMNSLRKERDSLSTRVTKYESSDEQRQKEHREMIADLTDSKKGFDDERVRIRREDEERLQQELEERDRKWNDHEQNVIALLSNIVKKEDSKFSAFSNTKLPAGFSGSLKPDFMIEFLEQYVIFDAKVSRSQDLQSYIKDAVKKTATKVKGNEMIFRSIYLVVPTQAIDSLKQLSFYEEGFHFYVVSPEALEPILAGLKRIESYEFAEAMNPEERENIVDMIASFLFHISTRNATELALTYHGMDTLNRAEKANPELVADAIIKKAKMRNLNLSTATREWISNPKALAQELQELTEPKSKISQKDLNLF